MAAEMSVKLLESNYSNDTNLLYFLGCLPGGVSQETLTEMWGKPNEVTQSIERFTELSLLEVGVKKIQLTPTMLKFIEENIDHRSKNEYMESISDYYN